jgi:hypothetical protein
MSEEPKLAAGSSYEMRNIGAGALIAHGKNISWVNGIAPAR